MKKIISILFVILYLAVNTGLIVGVHNCLLKGNDYFVGKTESKCCCAVSGVAEDSSCCNETTVIVKLDDVQSVSETLQFKLSQPIIFLPYFFSEIKFDLEQLNKINSIAILQLEDVFEKTTTFKIPKFILYKQAVFYA